VHYSLQNHGFINIQYFQGVKQTAQQMQTQAQPHVDEIKNSGQVVVQHGKNALQALKDAVTDILHTNKKFPRVSQLSFILTNKCHELYKNNGQHQ
jgi:biopolymer transport protein ExbD